MIHADVCVGVDHLSLEVRALDDVVVDDRELADAGRREVLDDRGAEAARTDDERAALEEARLAVRPDLLHDDVSGVAVELRRVERERHTFASARDRYNDFPAESR